MGPGDERRPGRIGVGDLGLAASARCQFRRVAAGPLAIDGSLGAAWTVEVRLACVSVTASVRTWSDPAWRYWLGWCLGARLPSWREHAGHRGRRPGILGGDVAL